jgi:hypothetical protein
MWVGEEVKKMIEGYGWVQIGMSYWHPSFTNLARTVCKQDGIAIKEA